MIKSVARKEFATGKRGVYIQGESGSQWGRDQAGRKSTESTAGLCKVRFGVPAKRWGTASV